MGKDTEVMQKEISEVRLQGTDILWPLRKQLQCMTVEATVNKYMKIACCYIYTSIY